MSRKFSDEDRRAIDLFLDHSTGNHGVTRMAASVSQRRLTAAQRLLKLLDAMPVMEPSTDLVARTMDRIDHATVGRIGHPTRRPHTGPVPPVA
jgi:hypothetical protein